MNHRRTGWGRQGITVLNLVLLILAVAIVAVLLLRHR
jgi:hypothetical protein